VCRDIFDSAAVERLSRSYDAQFPALEPGEGEGGVADPADRGLARRFPPSLADGNPFRADFLEATAVLDVVENLLGPDFLFLTAACVRFAGETPWHWCAQPHPPPPHHGPATTSTTLTTPAARPPPRRLRAGTAGAPTQTRQPITPE